MCCGHCMGLSPEGCACADAQSVVLRRPTAVLYALAGLTADYSGLRQNRRHVNFLAKLHWCKTILLTLISPNHFNWLGETTANPPQFHNKSHCCTTSWHVKRCCATVRLAAMLHSLLTNNGVMWLMMLVRPSWSLTSLFSTNMAILETRLMMYKLT